MKKDIYIYLSYVHSCLHTCSEHSRLFTDEMQCRCTLREIILIFEFLLPFAADRIIINLIVIATFESFLSRHLRKKKKQQQQNYD